MLEAVKRPDGETVTFAYDALGRRIYKKFKKTFTNFAWDGNVPLHQWKSFTTQDALTDKVITWIFEEDSYSPVAKLYNGKTFSIINDQLGTPIEGYSEEGDLIWERELNSNGKVLKQTGKANFCPFLYQGQSYDPEIALAYNRFRYYDPEDGRYISQDPIGLLSGEFGFYNYVGDTNGWIDVFGLAKSYSIIKSKNRTDAIRQAKNYAKVPRPSKGGKKIGMEELKPTSRGKNWEEMKAKNATSLGAENPKGKNKWMEHPDGHPDKGQPGVPEHHDSGHIHSVNPQGQEIVFTW